MAYSKYITEVKDKDNEVYGIIDEEAREDIANQKSAFASTNDAVLNNVTGLISFEQGTFNRTTGATYSSTTGIRTTGFIPENVVRISCSSSYKIVVWAWKKSDSSFVGHIMGNGTYGTESSYLYFTDYVFDWNVDYKYKITFHNSDGSTIEPSAGSNCITWITTDKTLTKENKAADAKATGVRLEGETVDITDQFTFTNSKIIKIADGAYANGGDSYKATVGFVNVEGYNYLKITIPQFIGDPACGLAFYSADSYENFISAVAFPKAEVWTPIEITVQIPPTAKYIRTTYWVTTEVSFSCKKIIVGTNEKINDLEDELLTKCTLGGWEIGSFNTETGKNYYSDTAIRNQEKIGIPTGTVKISCDDDYYFLLYAWHKNGTFIGSMKVGHIFDNFAGNYGLIKEFNCYEYPDYVFRVSLRRVDSSYITIAEGKHCYFYDKKDKKARHDLSTRAPVVYENASGLLVDISDGAEGIPFKSISVDIAATQTGSGDPSPDNIRPIHGFTKCKLIRSGENMLGGDFLFENIKQNLSPYSGSVASRYITYASGANTLYVPGESGFSGMLTNKFKENTVYTFIFTYYKASGTGANMKYSYTNGDTTNFPTVSATGEKQTKVFSTVSTKTLQRIYKSASSGTTRVYYDECGLFEGTRTLDKFVPYNGQTIIVDWENDVGSVYGGKFNLTTGKLIVTHGNIDSYDGEELPGVWISDRDVYVEGTTPTTGAHVVYELAEPIEYQLEGDTSLTTLYGKNYLSCNMGAIEVEYPVDTKLYIDGKIAELQALILEN